MTVIAGNGPMGEMKRVLRIRDGLAITVGIVIGAGILRTPGPDCGVPGQRLADPVGVGAGRVWSLR